MGQVIKPAVPKGTRDFSPETMRKRNFLFHVIRRNFEKFGFQPIETPAMENLSTLTGKYGEEGDRLIFKILNSGDFLSKADRSAIAEENSGKLAGSIAEKALRYDLTVPFARYVVQHQHEINFPFRRYQMQPVWRADRPQKGRYREFYQCDADVIGSASLLSEAELIQLFGMTFDQLALPVTIMFNNRKILKGIVEVMGAADRFSEVAVVLDKLDKIGAEKVAEELRKLGIADHAVFKLNQLFNLPLNNEERLRFMNNYLQTSETGLEGLKETETVWSYLTAAAFNMEQLQFDPLLARGLDYYTGAIFEVVARKVSIGSICGGGRYDDLTGIFGMEGLSGVGISFGIDRIYDVMEELKLFPENEVDTTQLLFINFGEQEIRYILPYATRLRTANIKVEIYPEAAKMKKQMKYADALGVRYVAMAGTEEMREGTVALKDMKSGTQEQVDLDQLLNKITSHE